MYNGIRLGMYCIQGYEVRNILCTMVSDWECTVYKGIRLGMYCIQGYQIRNVLYTMV